MDFQRIFTPSKTTISLISQGRFVCRVRSGTTSGHKKGDQRVRKTLPTEILPDNFQGVSCKVLVCNRGCVLPFADTRRLVDGRRRQGTSQTISRRTENHGWAGHTGQTITILAFSLLIFLMHLEINAKGGNA